jgi:4-hydroxy-4-methyl-2-oxoglutarate aldolase
VNPHRAEGPDGGRLGHAPVIPLRVDAPPPPLDDELARQYASAAAADVSDAVGRLFTMDSGIRPLYAPMRPIVGVALTVRLPAGDNWALHGALLMAGPGHVLVVDWQGYREGCGSGAASLVEPIRRGLAGIVVDGCWRDVAELRALDFPIAGRGVTAFSPSKSEFGEIGVPACCGGVVVESGDVVVADEDGCAVVPRAHAATVAAALAARTAARRATGGPHPDAASEGTDRIGRAYSAAHAAMVEAQGTDGSPR